MDPLTVFILSLIAPFIFCRLLLYLWPKSFQRPLIKRITGLQIHHYHYGLLLLLIAALGLVDGRYQYSVLLFGVGLGLLLDEATTVMLIPSDPKMEFEAYRKSFTSTAVLFCCVSLLMLIFTSLRS